MKELAFYVPPHVLAQYKPSASDTETAAPQVIDFYLSGKIESNFLSDFQFIKNRKSSAWNLSNNDVRTRLWYRTEDLEKTKPDTFKVKGLPVKAQQYQFTPTEGWLVSRAMTGDALHKLAVRLYPNSPMLKAMETSSYVETAARPFTQGSQAYEWCEFTGKKGITLTYHNTDYVLRTGDMFGVKVDSKADRIVMLKTGITKVFTLSREDTAYISQRCRHAPESRATALAMDAEAAYKIWEPLRRKMAKFQLVPVDGAYKALKVKIGKGQQQFEAGNMDEVMRYIRTLTKFIADNVYDIDLETPEDNAIATKFLRSIDRYSDGAPSSIFDDMASFIDATQIVKAVAAKEIRTAKKLYAKNFGGISELHDSIPQKWFSLVKRYENNDPVIEQVSSGKVRVRQASEPAIVNEPLSLRGAISKRAYTVFDALNEWAMRDPSRKITQRDFNRFMSHPDIVELGLTERDIAVINNAYTKYLNTWSGKAGTISGNAAENKSKAEASGVEVGTGDVNDLLGGNATLDTLKSIAEKMVPSRRANKATEAIGEDSDDAQPSDASSGGRGRIRDSLETVIEKVAAAINPIPVKGKVKKFVVQKYEEQITSSRIIKALCRTFNLESPAGFEAADSVGAKKKPSTARTASKDLKSSAANNPSVAGEVGETVNPKKSPGRVRATFEEFVDKIEAKAGVDLSRKRKMLAVIREVYEEGGSVARAMRRIGLTADFDDSVAENPSNPAPEVVAEQLTEGGRGRKRASLEVFMQKVEDKCGIEIDQDKGLREFVTNGYNSGASVNQMVKALVGNTENGSSPSSSPVEKPQGEQKRSGRAPKLDLPKFQSTDKATDLDDDEFGAEDDLNGLDDLLNDVEPTAPKTKTKAPKVQPKLTEDEDSFADLDSLLGGDEVKPTAPTAPSEPSFDDLDSLLGGDEEPEMAPTPAPKVAPTPTPESQESFDEDFDDLDSLLGGDDEVKSAPPTEPDFDAFGEEEEEVIPEPTPESKPTRPAPREPEATTPAPAPEIRRNKFTRVDPSKMEDTDW